VRVVRYAYFLSFSVAGCEVGLERRRLEMGWNGMDCSVVWCGGLGIGEWNWGDEGRDLMRIGLSCADDEIEYRAYEERVGRRGKDMSISSAR
jgi:hypothetical protein